jgi:hypothetical protein
MKTALISCMPLAFTLQTALACTHPQPSPVPTVAQELTELAPAPCDAQTPVLATCRISANSVHPTQFAVGLKDVQKKREKVAKIKNDPKELRDFLKKKTPPAVKGPEDVFYIVDGHHTTRALSEESVPSIFIKITKDYSDLTNSDFWERMKSENLVWLYDENGEGPKDPIYIPNSITDLPDDPFRSLSEDAKQLGAYQEHSVFYQQFIWANFFRKFIPKEKVTNEYDAAVQDAVKIAKSPEASGLPGYQP